MLASLFSRFERLAGVSLFCVSIQAVNGTRRMQRHGCILGGSSPRRARTDIGAENDEWTQHAGLFGAAMQTLLDEGVSQAAKQLQGLCSGPPAGGKDWQRRVWIAGGDDDEYYWVRDYPYPEYQPQQPVLRALAGGSPERMCLTHVVSQLAQRGRAVVFERLFYGGRYVQVSVLWA
jgi:hypothetical protein